MYVDSSIVLCIDSSTLLPVTCTAVQLYCFDLFCLISKKSSPNVMSAWHVKIDLSTSPPCCRIRIWMLLRITTLGGLIDGWGISHWAWGRQMIALRATNLFCMDILQHAHWVVLSMCNLIVNFTSPTLLSTFKWNNWTPSWYHLVPRRNKWKTPEWLVRD